MFFRLQDLQGRKQLRVAICGAPPLMRQCRQRANYIKVPDLRAVPAFHAPDGGQDARIYTVLLPQLLKKGVLADQQLLSFLDGGRCHTRVEIVPQVAGEFGLLLIQCLHRWIGRDTSECVIQRGGSNAGGKRTLAEVGQPLFEAHNGCRILLLRTGVGCGGCGCFGSDGLRCDAGCGHTNADTERQTQKARSCDHGNTRVGG